MRGYSIKKSFTIEISVYKFAPKEFVLKVLINWRSPNLSELKSLGLTHLDSEASNYCCRYMHSRFFCKINEIDLVK